MVPLNLAPLRREMSVHRTEMSAYRTEMSVYRTEMSAYRTADTKNSCLALEHISHAGVLLS